MMVARGESPAFIATPTMDLILWLLLPLLLVVAVILWLTESREQRIRRWYKQGMSQRRIADRLCCSRYAVRKVLA
jgi:hypothetical protein